MSGTGKLYRLEGKLSFCFRIKFSFMSFALRKMSPSAEAPREEVDVAAIRAEDFLEDEGSFDSGASDTA